MTILFVQNFATKFRKSMVACLISNFSSKCWVISKARSSWPRSSRWPYIISRSFISGQFSFSVGWYLHSWAVITSYNTYCKSSGLTRVFNSFTLSVRSSVMGSFKSALMEFRNGSSLKRKMTWFESYWLKAHKKFRQTYRLPTRSLALIKPRCLIKASKWGSSTCLRHFKDPRIFTLNFSMQSLTDSFGFELPISANKSL